MKSLFITPDNHEIIYRINLLASDTKAVWGKMQVNQMVAHCQIPLRVAFGEMKLKRGLFGILFGGMAKKQLLKPGQFKKNMPTAPIFIVRTNPVFEEEKNKLIVLVTRFSEKGHEAISKEPHPFFGKLTVVEWDTLQWKHLDHHLRQFGV